MDVLSRLRQAVSKEPSLDDMTSEVRQAWRSLVGQDVDSWVHEVYADTVVVMADSTYYRIPYTRGDEITFAIDQATEVENEWVAKTVVIEKVDEERHLAFGWAYVYEKDGERVIDHSGEFIAKEDLEDAAYIFARHFREGDEQHTDAVKAHLVESFVSTPEKLEKMGLDPDALPHGWWTGWHIPEDEVWGKVKDGTYSMLSIGGTARREAVDA